MSEVIQEPSSAAPPPPPPAQPAPAGQCAPDAATGTGHVLTNAAIAFARRHPALTLIGTAGAGLIGGLELAVGVVIGAGVAALVRARDERATVAERHEAGDDARTLIRRLSPELKKRARAVIQAARGKLTPVTS